MENNKTEEIKEKSAEIKDFLVSVIGNAPIGIMTINMGQIITVCNQSLLRILKKDISIEKAINQPISVFLKNIPALLKAIDHEYSKGRQSFNMPMISYEDRFLAIRARKISDGMLFFVDDITERRKMEQQLTEEKTKDEAILASIGDGVFVVDLDLKMVLANQIATDLCQSNIKEMIGQHYDHFFKFAYGDKQKGKYTDSFIIEAIKTDQMREMANHVVLIRPDGSQIPVAGSASPLKDKDGKVIGCVVVFRDITKERAIDKAKTEFVSLASHQLRTPLSMVKWYAEMLLAGDVGKLTKDQRKYLEEIDIGNRRMIELVNALLNVSRIEMGTLAIEPKPTDFMKIIQEVLKESEPDIKQKKLKVQKNYDKNLPQILADPKLSRIIFQNLITNAIKYTPDKGQVTISLEKQEPNVLIKVADTGYGIPKSQQSKIFTKLFRADNIRIKDTQGTGLGLYLVHSIIEAFGGKIWFKSEENKGTTFFLSLPLIGMRKKEGSKGLEESKY